MDKIKIMTIFGTRPEAVKMAPLIHEFKKYTEIESIVCVTAQHREMLDQVLDIFEIEPQYDLDIMKDRQTLSEITSRVLVGLENVIKEVEPDLILVHGDTTTTFVGSLAAFYNKVKIGHVEAGLRSMNKYFPYPEEINRKLTGVLADMHFAPTDNSKKNLLNEGISDKSIYITGNTAIDAMHETIDDNYKFDCDELNQIDFTKKKVIMVTAHRRENWGEPLENICRALKRIALSNSDVEIVYLVHLNPIVKETAHGILNGISNVHLLPPLDIKGSHNLISRSYIILSDSGGLQEEAPHLGKPLLLLRGVTERPEAVSAGTVRIIGTDEERVFEETVRLLQSRESYGRMATAINPYGDGKAAKRITEAILYEFGFVERAPEDYHARR